MTAVYVEWGLMALAFPIVCTRLYFQKTRKGRFFWSDGFVVLAWIFFAFQTAADWTMRHFYTPTYQVIQTGGGTTLGSLRPGNTKAQTLIIGKMKYAENVTYYSCLYMVKFAWLCFFHTLIPRTLPKLRRLYWITTWVSIIGWVFTTLIMIFYCWPISRHWALDDTYCANADWTWIVIMSLHTATDLTIYLLPIMMLRHVHALKLRSRVGVTALFSLGFICISWAIVVQVENLTYVTGAVACITMAFEQFWAVFVVCLPPLKAIVSGEARLVSGWFSSRRGSSSRTTGSYWSRTGATTDPERTAGTTKELNTFRVEDGVQGEDGASTKDSTDELTQERSKAIVVERTRDSTVEQYRTYA